MLNSDIESIAREVAEAMKEFVAPIQERVAANDLEIKGLRTELGRVRQLFSAQSREIANLQRKANANT